MSREMKDSGVEWIGEIPSSWGVVKTKQKYKYRKEIVRERVSYFERLSLTLNGVLRRRKDDSNGLQPEKFEGYQVLYKNELVFKLIDLENVNTSRVGLSMFIGLVSPAYIVLNNPHESSYGYFYYYSMWQREIFNHIGGDGVRSALNKSDLLEIPYLNIPQAERDKITEHLQEKVFNISSIIRKTKSTIEDYKLLKQSIITEAVTKGLDKNVEMKDSGVEWNRHIPIHWEIVSPKRLFIERKERAKKTDEQLTASQKHGIISQTKFMVIENQKVVLVEKNHSILKHVEPNDFVISMRSFQGGLEHSTVRGCISSAYVMLIPNEKVYAPYFRWLFKSVKYINALQSTSNLIRDGQALRYANFIKVPLFIFSITEQMKIANYLDRTCPVIDGLIDEKMKLISELERYKKSLIYEYVTGKKEVE